ncbi:hypothetical protein ACFWUQ_18410 [Streptomyces sp. NPDC058662]|uniref:hypothetical protein n=1 Tax=Streptomyces sp. NPDC058662 TaxID=3346583 RepID=UPI0036680F77
MKSLELVRIEAGLHDWAGMECGCSVTRTISAEHIPDILIGLLEQNPGRLSDEWAENHAYIQSNLMEPAVATTHLVVAALAGRPPVGMRHDLLRIMTALVCGEQDDIADACLDVAREAAWLLYEEFAAFEAPGTSAVAYDLLRMMDEQSERLAAYHAVYGARLPHP